MHARRKPEASKGWRVQTTWGPDWEINQSIYGSSLAVGLFRGHDVPSPPVLQGPGSVIAPG